MPDFRVYHPVPAGDFAELKLAPAESHHLVAVNRCQRGDLVIAFDGHGREWATECVDPSKNAAVLRVKSSHQATPLPYQITLAQALPKGATMDEIIRQATEVGTTQIFPLLTERTQVHLDADRQDKKLEKWRTTAIEAAKQCGNPWLPEIFAAQSFSTFLASTATGYDLKLVASLHAGTTHLKAALTHYRAHHAAPPRKVLWLVGPEGDFTPMEMTATIKAGFHPITFGPLVLRSDTAAIYALSILSHELQVG